MEVLAEVVNARQVWMVKRVAMEEMIPRNLKSRSNEKTTSSGPAWHRASRRGAAASAAGGGRGVCRCGA